MLSSEYSEHSDIWNIFVVTELSQGEIQTSHSIRKIHSTENIQIFYGEETPSWNQIVKSEERMPHLEEVAFLSLISRSASAKTLANREGSK